MVSPLKRRWRSLKHAPSGERFIRYYRNHNDPDRPVWRRVVSIAIGVVIMLGGIVALPAPGPGTLVIVIGAALLAKELKVVARALDAIERWLRGLWRWARRTWKKTSPAGRAGLAIAGGLACLAVLALAAVLIYRFVR
jgi:uncharacterized protein (TIGR02611 family)